MVIFTMTSLIFHWSSPRFLLPQHLPKIRGVLWWHPPWGHRDFSRKIWVVGPSIFHGIEWEIHGIFLQNISNQQCDNFVPPHGYRIWTGKIRENGHQWMEWDTLWQTHFRWSFLVIFFSSARYLIVFDWMSLFSHKPTIFMHQQNLAGSTSDVWLLNLHHFSMVKRFNLPAFQTVETESTFSNFLSVDGGHLPFFIIFRWVSHPRDRYLSWVFALCRVRPRHSDASVSACMGRMGEVTVTILGPRGEGMSML